MATIGQISGNYKLVQVDEGVDPGPLEMSVSEDNPNVLILESEGYWPEAFKFAYSPHADKEGAIQVPGGSVYVRSLEGQLMLTLTLPNGVRVYLGLNKRYSGNLIIKDTSITFDNLLGVENVETGLINNEWQRTDLKDSAYNDWYPSAGDITAIAFKTDENSAWFEFVSMHDGEATPYYPEDQFNTFAMWAAELQTRPEFEDADVGDIESAIRSQLYPLSAYTLTLSIAQTEAE